MKTEEQRYSCSERQKKNPNQKQYTINSKTSILLILLLLLLSLLKDVNFGQSNQFGGGKKISSAVLFELNCFSTSGETLKAACSTCGDSAFHTEVLPAK